MKEELKQLGISLTWGFPYMYQSAGYELTGKGGGLDVD